MLVVLVCHPTPLQFYHGILTQFLQAARGEPRINIDDPFAKRNKKFKYLGGLLFDRTSGMASAGLSKYT